MCAYVDIQRSAYSQSFEKIAVLIKITLVRNHLHLISIHIRACRRSLNKRKKKKEKKRKKIGRPSTSFPLLQIERRTLRVCVFEREEEETIRFTRLREREGERGGEREGTSCFSCHQMLGIEIGTVRPPFLLPWVKIPRYNLHSWSV